MTTVKIKVDSWEMTNGPRRHCAQAVYTHPRRGLFTHMAYADDRRRAEAAARKALLYLIEDSLLHDP